MEGVERVFEALKELKIEFSQLEALSIHGPAAFGDLNEPSQLLAVFKDSYPLKIERKKQLQMNFLIVFVGEREFLEDCSEEKLGGAVAGVFLLPYVPLIGVDFLRKADITYKRHVILESLQNLVLEHRLASTRLLINPKFFLYDKLKRFSIVYPLIRPYVEASLKIGLKQFIKNVMWGFEEGLNSLVKEGIVVRKGKSYSPSEKFVKETISKKIIFTKFSKELEHMFRLYLAARPSSPIDSIKDLGIDLTILKPIKIPDPSEMVMIETSLGPQPLLLDIGIKQFIEVIYGVKGEAIELRKAAGVLNSAYIAKFKMGDEEAKIFVKKYLNWTDFKWFAAWLWSVGVKNFSVLASIRLSNEVYFANKLLELGFNVPEILHVNWPKKILLTKFIEGRNFMKILTSGIGAEEIEEKSRRVGQMIGRLHKNNISMGDCNPFNVIFSSDDEVYLVDLEQCSCEGPLSWDLAEMLFYTAHYLDMELAERFGCSLVDGYLMEGRVEDVIEAVDPKYSRVFFPLTPPWVQARIREAVVRKIKK